MASDTRPIHIHLTTQPGTTVHVTIEGNGIAITSDDRSPGGASMVVRSSDDALAAAIERLQGSGVSPNVRQATDGLLAMGYVLRLPETNIPGKRRENYLRIMDPVYTAHGIGYLTPSMFSFSRTSDRGRLADLPGAALATSAVHFSHVQSAQPGLDAARLLAETPRAAGVSRSSKGSPRGDSQPDTEAPLFTHCQRCGYPFGALIRQQACGVRQACDRRLREPGYRVPSDRQQDLAIRDATLAGQPELGRPGPAAAAGPGTGPAQSRVVTALTSV